jgi:hypothetical protein
MTTLLTLQRRSTWWWVVCPNNNCMHEAPVALAPFIIRWGPDAPRERLERAAKCERCGHQGGTLEHPTRGSGASIDADLMFPVENMRDRPSADGADRDGPGSLAN